MIERFPSSVSFLIRALAVVAVCSEVCVFADSYAGAGCQGQILFSDGELAEYRLAPGAVLVVVEKSGSLYFIQHRWDDQGQEVRVQGFAGTLEKTKVVPLTPERRPEGLYFSLPRGGGSARPSFLLRAVTSSESGHPDPLDTVDSSVCCVPCGPRLICGTAIDISCGSCSAENLY